MSEIQRCDNCLFAEVLFKDDGSFICHRYPPVLMSYRAPKDALLSEIGPEFWSQPKVFGENWCGEFKAIEDIDNSEQKVSDATIGRKLKDE